MIIAHWHKHRLTASNELSALVIMYATWSTTELRNSWTTCCTVAVQRYKVCPSREPDGRVPRLLGSQRDVALHPIGESHVASDTSVSVHHWDFNKAIVKSVQTRADSRLDSWFWVLDDRLECIEFKFWRSEITMERVINNGTTRTTNRKRRS